MIVHEHTIPFFLPIREAENDLLSSNAMVRSVSCIVYANLLIVEMFLFLSLVLLIYFQKFIDHVGELLQAYVDRREQVGCWFPKGK